MSVLSAQNGVDTHARLRFAARPKLLTKNQHCMRHTADMIDELSNDSVRIRVYN